MTATIKKYGRRFIRRVRLVFQFHRKLSFLLYRFFSHVKFFKKETQTAYNWRDWRFMLTAWKYSSDNPFRPLRRWLRKHPLKIAVWIGVTLFCGWIGYLIYLGTKPLKQISLPTEQSQSGSQNNEKIFDLNNLRGKEPLLKNKRTLPDMNR